MFVFKYCMRAYCIHNKSIIYLSQRIFFSFLQSLSPTSPSLECTQADGSQCDFFPLPYHSSASCYYSLLLNTVQLLNIFEIANGTDVVIVMQSSATLLKGTQIPVHTHTQVENKNYMICCCLGRGLWNQYANCSLFVRARHSALALSI